MQKTNSIYRKNLSLIVAFLILISVLFVVAVFVSYELNARYVESEFQSKKIDIWDQTIKPYEDLFQNKIPEITSYQGYLDSALAAKYADSVFNKYHFVQKIVFYDARVSNHANSTVVRNNLGISIDAMYQYSPNHGKVSGIRIWNTANEDDFKEMAVKLSDYVAFSDTSKNSTPDEIFNSFYGVKPGEISYSNILRREDVKNYRELSKDTNPPRFFTNKPSSLSF